LAIPYVTQSVSTPLYHKIRFTANNLQSTPVWLWKRYLEITIQRYSYGTEGKLELFVLLGACIEIKSQVFYIGGIFYTLGVALVKIAFLCFYLKLFPSRPFRKVAYPLLVICFLFGGTFTFLFIFQCSPISYAWMQWDGEADGKCLNFDIGAVIHAIVNILLDIAIFALPLTQLWGLNLSRKKKIHVMLMFSVGFL
jgi:hypothetical protein